MTDTRMNKLLRELNLPKNSVYIPDKDSILNRVERKLEKTETRTVRGTMVFKALALAVIVVLMLALSIVAFGKDGVVRKIITIIEENLVQSETTPTEEKVIDYIPVTEVTTEVATEVPTEKETEKVKVNPKYESPIFDKYHQEEADKLQDLVMEVYGRVEDDNFALIVNEVLGDETNIYMTITIEAKNNEARELLMTSTKSWLDVDAFSTVTGQWINAGGGTSEEYNMRRENSRSFLMHVFGDADRIDGYGMIRVTSTLFDENMKSERYVYFEMEKSKDVIAFNLEGQRVTGCSIEITPMGIKIIKGSSDTSAYARDVRNLNTFFRLKNGSIRSFNQMAGFDTATQLVAGRSDLYCYETSAKNVIELDSIQSVIVEGIEYPVGNPSGYYSTDVPDKLKPFVLYDVYVNVGGTTYVCNLSQLESCIDITYKGDDAVEFTYGGKSYRVQSGSNTVVINGKTNYSLRLNPVQENGEMWVGMDFINYLLGIRYGEISGTGTYLFVP